MKKQLCLISAALVLLLFVTISTSAHAENTVSGLLSNQHVDQIRNRR